MTVLRPCYLDELLSGLRRRGHEVQHVVLDAPAEVVDARITADENDPPAASWRWRHIAEYEAARNQLRRRGITVDTRGVSARQVAAQIANALAMY